MLQPPVEIAEHTAALQDRGRGTASDSTHGPGGLGADSCGAGVVRGATRPSIVAEASTVNRPLVDVTAPKIVSAWVCSARVRILCGVRPRSRLRATLATEGR